MSSFASAASPGGGVRSGSVPVRMMTPRPSVMTSANSVTRPTCLGANNTFNVAGGLRRGRGAGLGSGVRQLSAGSRTPGMLGPQRAVPASTPRGRESYGSVNAPSLPMRESLGSVTAPSLPVRESLGSLTAPSPPMRESFGSVTAPSLPARDGPSDLMWENHGGRERHIPEAQPLRNSRSSTSVQRTPRGSVASTCALASCTGSSATAPAFSPLAPQTVRSGSAACAGFREGSRDPSRTPQESRPMRSRSSTTMQRTPRVSDPAPGETPARSESTSAICTLTPLGSGTSTPARVDGSVPLRRHGSSLTATGGSSGSTHGSTSTVPDRLLALNVVVCRVLASWPSAESKRFVMEAMQSVESTARGAWGVDQVRQFGLAVLRAHGLGPVEWPDSVWMEFSSGAPCLGRVERLAHQILQHLASELRLQATVSSAALNAGAHANQLRVAQAAEAVGLVHQRGGQVGADVRRPPVEEQPSAEVAASAQPGAQARAPSARGDGLLSEFMNAGDADTLSVCEFADPDASMVLRTTPARALVSPARHAVQPDLGRLPVTAETSGAPAAAAFRPAPISDGPSCDIQLGENLPLATLEGSRPTSSSRVAASVLAVVVEDFVVKGLEFASGAASGEHVREHGLQTAARSEPGEWSHASKLPQTSSSTSVPATQPTPLHDSAPDDGLPNDLDDRHGEKVIFHPREIFSLPKETTRVATPETSPPPCETDVATDEETTAKTTLGAGPRSAVSVDILSDEELAAKLATSCNTPVSGVWEPEEEDNSVLFYRRKCLELTSQVARRDAQILKLRKALKDARGPEKRQSMPRKLETGRSEENREAPRQRGRDALHGSRASSRDSQPGARAGRR